MKKELATKYDPSSFEDRLYAMWSENGYFTPLRDDTKTPFLFRMYHRWVMYLKTAPKMILHRNENC